MGYYSTIESEILPYVTAWMDPEGIAISKVSLTENNFFSFHKAINCLLN